MNKNIYVTRPLLPPLEELIPDLYRIWDNKILTNNGEYHQRFELALSEYLGVEHICIFNNATIAMLAAIKSLDLSGEVITTPYSFVATSHSLMWCGLKPVFVDINPTTFNIDPEKIEAAITPETSAILAVHCYGTPCEHEKIKVIADKHDLKVVYDAAHAFAINDQSGSILRYGDLSIVSFHATKVFNTFEGGAVICPDKDTKISLEYLKNFGFVDEITVVSQGINGKMNEFNAAFGLLQLKYIDEAISKRKNIDSFYREELKAVSGIEFLSIDTQLRANYGYFPIIIGDKYILSRDELYQKLRDNNIYARRYFYPAISEFPMYKDLPSARETNLSVALDVSRRILCLPIFPDMTVAELKFICSLIIF